MSLDAEPVTELGKDQFKGLDMREQNDTEKFTSRTSRICINDFTLDC